MQERGERPQIADCRVISVDPAGLLAVVQFGANVRSVPYTRGITPQQGDYGVLVRPAASRTWVLISVYNLPDTGVST
jgi:hypothetical protein